MIQIYADQIFLYVKEIQSLKYSYVLFGKNNIFLQENKNFILKSINSSRLIEQHNLQSDTEIDWIQTKNFLNNQNIFSKKKIITFSFLNKKIKKKDIDDIKNLTFLCNKDTILIIFGNENLERILKYNFFPRFIEKNLILINCSIINNYRMLEWIKNKAKSMNVFIGERICKFLYYSYEGNILELSQLIMRLSLVYPKKKLVMKDVKILAKKSMCFLPIHLVNSLLKRNQKKSLEIIQQISYSKIIEPIFLLRIIQKEILLLISLIKNVPKMNKNNTTNVYRKKNKIQNALKSMNVNKLYKLVNIMKIIEFSIKENSTLSVWTHFYTLILIFCKTE